MAFRRRRALRRLRVRGLGFRVLLPAIAIAAIAGVIAWLSGGGEVQSPDPTATPPAATATTATTTEAIASPTAPTILTLLAAPDPARLQRAEVIDVIDGDTIDVLIAGREERVRYYGVDTRERGEACFREATARNEQLVGDAVLLLPDARERDRYDRLLRYVFTEEGESIDARLIAEGLGLAWRRDGAYREELIAIETTTRAAGVGCLW